MVEKDNMNFDVIIAGAGIAGLAAARQLTEQGLSVVILEARDRIGGRLLTVTENGFHIDLGATWFWPTETRVTALVSTLKLETFSQYTNGDSVYESTDGVERIKGNPVDVYSGRFLSGAQSLAQALANEIPKDVIRLIHPVQSIQKKDKYIQAITPYKIFSAKHIIVAIPPALCVSSIDFNPPLPDNLVHLAQVTPVWMGAITKVVAVYSEPFWRYDGLAGSAISYVGPMREIHDMSGPDGNPAVLFGFAPPTSVNEPTVSKPRVLEQLTTLFGPKADMPKKLFIHDWRHEQFTSPPEVERITTYQAFGHSAYSSPALDGRLHWASSETSAESPGHIEGALVAADRAVNMILHMT